MSCTDSMSDEEMARRLQEEFERDAAEKEARARFDCPVCLNVSRMDGSVELDCGHRFCQDCLHGFLADKIREKRVSPKELQCPMPKCCAEITDLQVEGATKSADRALWERFLDARVELWRPDAASGERLTECPMPACRGVCLVAADANTVACPRCNLRFCSRCGFRHPKMTCEQHAAQRQQDDAERDFQAMLEREGWQRCPKCKAPCERQEGCMFMRCESETCRGWTCFCYLCGKELNELQHFTHFPEGGFEFVCDNVDRRNHPSFKKSSGTGPPPPEVYVAIHRLGNRLSHLLGGAA